MPKFKLKYEDLENIKTDHVNTVVFNLLQIEQSKFLLDTRHIHISLFYSLKNMYKELENDIEGFQRPNHGYLVGWATQGKVSFHKQRKKPIFFSEYQTP